MFVARIKCVVIKDVELSGYMDEKEAAKNPWSYAGYEQEIDMTDWEVISVEELK